MKSKEKLSTLSGIWKPLTMKELRSCKVWSKNKKKLHNKSALKMWVKSKIRPSSSNFSLIVWKMCARMSSNADLKPRSPTLEAKHHLRAWRLNETSRQLWINWLIWPRAVSRLMSSLSMTGSTYLTYLSITKKPLSLSMSRCSLSPLKDQCATVTWRQLTRTTLWDPTPICSRRHLRMIPAQNSKTSSLSSYLVSIKGGMGRQPSRPWIDRSLL